MLNDENEIDAFRKLAEKPFNEILMDGLYLFGKKFGRLILYFLALLILSNFLIQVLTVELEWLIYNQGIRVEAIYDLMDADPEAVTEEDLLFITQYLLSMILVIFAQSLIGAFFTTLSMSLVASHLYKSYTKKENNSQSLINIKIFLPLFVIGLLVPTGFYILLIIPGIILFLFYIFSIFTYNMEGVEKPLKEARKIAKYSYSKILLVFLIAAGISSIVQFIYQSVLDSIWIVTDETYVSWISPDSRNYLMLFLNSLLRDLTGILLAPLFVSMLTPLFASFKMKKDLGYERVPARWTTRSNNTQEREYEPGIISESIDIPEVNRNRWQQRIGRFCPFCGNRRDMSLDYCPNCGESLKDIK
ncbi:MAG: hypothetical protein JW891_13995 [Candidatus Lokiarchaeota archaeon]|nr:hypothetical protein [Candidatus Lokiarchaeota archaeon]